MPAYEEDILVSGSIFEIHKFDQVINCQKAAQIGSVGSYAMFIHSGTLVEPLHTPMRSPSGTTRPKTLPSLVLLDMY